MQKAIAACLLLSVIDTLQAQNSPAPEQPKTVQGLPATGNKLPGAPAAEEPKPAKPEAETRKAQPANTRPPFFLGAEDVVMVRVWKQPEMGGQFPVRPDGKISLQLIGDVTAAGLTAEQLAADLTEALGKYINNPIVNVTVMQINSLRYTISGEINKPGPYTLATPVTVLDAIMLAGGVKEFAKSHKIVIVRGDQRLKFNYKDIVKGKHLEQNIKLQPGDSIIVP